MNDTENEYQIVLKRIKESEKYLDSIRGCMVGGAAGDALGYPVEFLSEDQIFYKFGRAGITEYELDSSTGLALISDDTQMSLFTANGLIVGDTRGCLRGIRGAPSAYVAHAYIDWFVTQNLTYDEFCNNDFSKCSIPAKKSWLCDCPGLYRRRDPGNTCMSALRSGKKGTVEEPVNDSKGCGGIMRVAPLALNYKDMNIKELDREGAEIAAITHGHSLGYMPAAVLTHIISRIVYPEGQMTLKEIIAEAKDTVSEIFSGDRHLGELNGIIDRAVSLSENRDSDLENIHMLGEGWVAEETLAVAIYCALRHQDDFSAGITAAVNHGGDSDSTGAVTGNILGALHGYDAIDEKWKRDLELHDVIIEISDDLCRGCQMSEYGSYRDPDWMRKYVYMNWKETDNGT